ncbi:MAG: RNA polymerase sigma factor [Fuerstiella sp.]|nr:RNA polymerase sigma factor [Fuerstiella sp.]
MELSGDVEKLLQRCRQGDEAALGDLMQSCQERVFQFTLRVSGDEALAEEATVECFYRVWTKCRQQKDGASAKAWIFRIAHRSLLDLIRKRKRWWKRLLMASRTPEDNSQDNPLAVLIEAEHQEVMAVSVKTAISTLKEEDRVLVHLFYVEGKGLAEIADVLKTSRDVLKMRLFRVRRKLAILLEPDDDRE